MRYHERSKHHFGRYARGPGRLDWANQPDPFRRRARAPAAARRRRGAALTRLRQPVRRRRAGRDGRVVQFVPVHRRAWHAGVSCWRGRERCNDFSVGVELEGTDDGAFEPVQYGSLRELVCALRAALPLQDIAAHSDVAPGRKSDPGAQFDWARLLCALAERNP
jgi:hypothetical protein